MASTGLLHKSDGVCHWMSRAVEEILNIKLCPATVGTDVEASTLIYSALVGAYFYDIPESGHSLTTYPCHY